MKRVGEEEAGKKQREKRRALPLILVDAAKPAGNKDAGFGSALELDCNR